GAVLPDVVVFPRATAEVARLLAYASAHGVPVTPVGANSSLEGHTVPVRGGVSLDLTRMDRVLEVRPQDLLAVVQPAVTYPRPGATGPPAVTRRAALPRLSRARRCGPAAAGESRPAAAEGAPRPA